MSKAIKNTKKYQAKCVSCGKPVKSFIFSPCDSCVKLRIQREKENDTLFRRSK